MKQIQKLGMIDAGWLLLENDRSPLHIGAAMFFDGHPSRAHEIYTHWRTLFQSVPATPPFNLILTRPTAFRPLYRWRESPTLNFQQHFRHLAIAPTPDPRKGVLDTISWLHSLPLDPDLPMWETTLISGYHQREFALYMKIHHSVCDGQGALDLLNRLVSSFKKAKLGPFWNPPQADHKKREKKPAKPLSKREILNETCGAIGTLLKHKLNGERSMIIPFASHRSPLNEPIIRGRAILALTYPIDELRQISKAFDSTVNDLLLTLVGAGLQNPAFSGNHELNSMIPVSLRSKEDHDMGNKLGFALAKLGNKTANPMQRLQEIKGSMEDAKNFLSELSKPSLRFLTAALDVVYLSIYKLPFLNRITPPIANLIVSNLRGPQEKKFLDGCELKSIYPVSILLHGQGMNITAMSYNQQLHLTIVADQRFQSELDSMGEAIQNDYLRLRKSLPLREIDSQHVAQTRTAKSSNYQEARHAAIL